VEALRLIKDDDELAILKEAALLGCRLFDHMLTFIRPGLSEIEVAAELEYQARRLGAEGMSFETIVASGPRSALPHGRATATLLPRRGFVTLDFGIIREGYCSDMTRTVHLGKSKAREREIYHAVLEAQESAVAAVSGGARCGDVDEAARSVLRNAGLAAAFSHSTGHGVGLEIHESPRVGAGQTTRLATGRLSAGPFWSAHRRHGGRQSHRRRSADPRPQGPHRTLRVRLGSCRKRQGTNETRRHPGFKRADRVSEATWSC
jgi:Xaa-Pro aminopeptidase